MRRKTVLAIMCVLLVIVLLPVVYYVWYVPHELGAQYVSVSFSLLCFSGPGSTPLHLDYNGKAIDANLVAIEINVTNSYFQPVYLSYNGFDVVWLIYNETVSDPSDVASNRNSLVWGAYYYLEYNAIRDPKKGSYDFTGDGLEYYSSRRELSNFTISIPTGGDRNYGSLFMPPSVLSGSWYGQYYSNESLHVSPGTYFTYCIIFGTLCNSQNVTITSISPF